MPTYILGISAFYHDSAAALLRDGIIVAAAQQERFSRQKHDAEFPRQAMEYCLAETGITPEQLDQVVFYDRPVAKFARLLSTYLAFSPAGLRSFLRSVPVWLKQKLYLPRILDENLGGRYQGDFLFASHHESHAASAFFPSPYQEAAILTMDGVGEWATATMGYGRGNRVTLTHQMRFPHSLGLLYSAFTYYCGFEVNSGEYKLMGLAPYGRPVYKDLILERLLRLSEDGSLWMDMSYFNYCQGLTMTSEKFHRLFGGPPRESGAPFTERDMDLAASIQQVTEEAMLAAARHLHKSTGLENLVLAGGVALNCVANSRIQREGPFRRVWVQPAAGDAGGALGAALFAWHQLLGRPRTASCGDSMQGALLGPPVDEAGFRTFLESQGQSYDWFPDEAALAERVAQLLAEGKVVGWAQGRMEFGPRALGSRSILGDPRQPNMQSVMNLKVKFRESFRPFAPVVAAEHAHEFFDVPAGEAFPYMLFVAPVRPERRLATNGRRGIDRLGEKRSDIPAVTHVDFSARLQTADPERHPHLHRLLEAFRRQTGCPVLVNTSFNLGWEPIVCTAEDAWRTMMATQIDALAVGRVLVRKPDQTMVSDASAAQADPWLDTLLACPRCQSPQLENMRCRACGQSYPTTEGVRRLSWNSPLRAEPEPGPTYGDCQSLRTLIDESRRNLLARLLNEQIPYQANVLEAGCGTGRLSNFLGIASRRVVGVDPSLRSLEAAEEFRRRFDLGNVRFLQMNLLHPAFRPAQFDYLLWNVAGDAAADSLSGFCRLAQLLRPGGYCLLRLHHSLARNGAGRRTRGRTISEAMKWFRAANFDFLASTLRSEPFQPLTERDRLFETAPSGGSFARLLLPFQAREGFFVIGRRRGEYRD